EEFEQVYLKGNQQAEGTSRYDARALLSETAGEIQRIVDRKRDEGRRSRTDADRFAVDETYTKAGHPYTETYYFEPNDDLLMKLLSRADSAVHLRLRLGKPRFEQR